MRCNLYIFSTTAVEIKRVPLTLTSNVWPCKMHQKHSFVVDSLQWLCNRRPDTNFSSNFTLTFTMILGHDMKLIVACGLVMYNQNTKNQVNKVSLEYYEIHSFNLLQNSTCLVVD